MIKVLQMVSSLNGGGIEKVIFDYYKYMDKKEIQFDFIKVKSKEKGILEDDLIQMGSNIFEIPPIKDSFRNYVCTLITILQHGNYDVIHCNGGYRSAVALIVAYFLGVPVRIAHAHTSNIPENAISKTVRIIFTIITKIFATSLFACGKQAAEWMWGKNYKKVIFVQNAINISNYTFSKDKRISFREEYGLNNKLVIGHIGRFSPEKNQSFLIDVIKSVVSKRNDVCLVLVGCGDTEEDIKAKVMQNNLNEYVRFLGVRDDVSTIINSFDIFVLPSLYEGLPVTLVEAQANGLSIFASDNITEQMAFNHNVTYLPLDVKLWSDRICESNTARDCSGSYNVKKAGYSIEEQAEYLLGIYKELCGKN